MVENMEKQKLKEAIEALDRSGFGDVDLFDVVHALKSLEASEINNSGLEMQLDYILGGMTLECLIQYLDPESR